MVWWSDPENQLEFPTHGHTENINMQFQLCNFYIDSYICDVEHETYS